MSATVWQLVDSSGIGGIERHVATLAGALCQRGIACEIVLYQRHGSNPWLEQLREGQAPVRLLDGTIGSLVAAIRRARPALLHTHGYKAGIIGRIAALLTQTPVVSSFHAGERAPFPVSLYQSLDAWTSITAQRIAISSAIASSLPYRSIIVPNFVELPVSESKARPGAVAFVGRFSHEKGPDLFCEIAAKTPWQVPFVAYGDGPMRAELENQYGGRVSFRGLVTAMEEEWPHIGLLLMPSRAEGLPMAALEALASGVPVAASRVGDLHTAAVPGETGWLFEPDDIGTAKAAVMEWAALDEAGRRRLSAACRDLATLQFGAQRGVASMLAIYRRAGMKPDATTH